MEPTSWIVGLSGASFVMALLLKVGRQRRRLLVDRRERRFPADNVNRLLASAQSRGPGTKT